MQIAHVKISNILGIAELEFSPGGFTEISGPNGAGKTSVLEAIKAVISGGHDATLIRKGEERGEIVLVLDNGTEIIKKVRPSGSTVDVVQGGKKTAKPQDAIRALTDMLSVNPVDFLRAPKKDRVRILLESMPIEVDAARLQSIAGIPVKIQPGIHGLHAIEAVTKEVYDNRTGTNRAVKEKEATINQLRDAIPSAPGGVQGSEDELRAQVAEADQSKEAELERVNTKLNGILVENRRRVEELRAEARRRIDEIKDQLQNDIDGINAEEREIERKAQLQREKTIQKHIDTVAPLNQAIDTIVQNREAHAKREQARATIKQMEDDLTTLREDAAKQTQALADIGEYKTELLAALPIPGLEVRSDGEVYRNGVPLDRLNTAQQVEIAVEVAKLRAGDLGVICVDGLELLDSATYEAFRDRALDSGLQLFVTRVSDSGFEIDTKE